MPAAGRLFSSLQLCRACCIIYTYLPTYTLPVLSTLALSCILHILSHSVGWWRQNVLARLVCKLAARVGGAHCTRQPLYSSPLLPQSVLLTQHASLPSLPFSIITRITLPSLFSLTRPFIPAAHRKATHHAACMPWLLAAYLLLFPMHGTEQRAGVPFGQQERNRQAATLALLMCPVKNTAWAEKDIKIKMHIHTTYRHIHIHMHIHSPPSPSPHMHMPHHYSLPLPTT